jgi:glycine/D-amino acid oxidase-like deaminating enzyme
MVKMDTKAVTGAPAHVGVAGGGLAGSTIALHLGGLGLKVTLLETGYRLINGMPFCHLHAGGNLYPELSDQECITFLRESVELLRAFPQAINNRPTVLVVPRHDEGTPEQLITRLKKLQSEYVRLVTASPQNKVLGEVEDYFRPYGQASLESLAELPTPARATSPDEWMIPVAKSLDLSTCRLPLILVNEPGLCALRLSAMATLALDREPNCTALTGCTVNHIAQDRDSGGWNVGYLQARGTGNVALEQPAQRLITVDYLVNACGYRAGMLDDMQGFRRERSVEFKASYLVHWRERQADWPEVVFHGERGTPKGMAQLTPFENGYFLIHGMTGDITLFDQGLSSAANDSAQPKLVDHLTQKLNGDWGRSEITLRSRKAINHIAQFIPAFNNASPLERSLYGAQQIPGHDPSARVANTSFDGNRYARSEIVKANSAVQSARAIAKALGEENLLPQAASASAHGNFAGYRSIRSLKLDEIVRVAEQLALDRHYPPELARPYGNFTL